MKEGEDIDRARQTVAAIEVQRRALDDELAAEMAAIEASFAAGEPLTRVVIKPKRNHVTVKLVALVWVPPSM
jgi:hypothetical protein